MRTRKRPVAAKPLPPAMSEKLARTLAEQSLLYREVTAEKEEIMRHKWLLSERAGYDVGYIRALYDWMTNHRAEWRKAWRRRNGSAPKL